MKIKKIIVLQPNPVIGGLEKLTLLIVNHLIKKGWHVTIISQKRGLTPKVKKRAGMIRIFLPLYADNILSRFVYIFLSLILIFLFAILDNVKILHSQISTRSFFVVSLSRIIYGKILGIRTSDVFIDDELNLGLNRFFPYLHKSIDVFVTLSEKMRRILMSFGVDKNKIKIIPPFIEDVLIEENVDLKQRKNNIEHENLHIISVGRLSPEKCIDNLIYACNLLNEMGIDFSLKILGNGPEINKLIKLTKNFNLQTRINFLGLLPHKKVYEEMRKSDIFVLPSRIEGLPLALLESMALGLLVVATAVGDIDTAIDHNINGFLLKSNNSKEIALTIRGLLFKKAQIPIICKNAIETIRARFIESKNLEKYSEIFKELAGMPN